jgi:uncharacterized protein (DUF2345 family)
VAGPNWGTHFLPRIGSEVLVEFLHGDIDQPRITGQLYNGEVAPPFGGGIDEKAQHPGVLSGLHTQSHDGGGTQQWVIDDTPGQLRTRLQTSLADSRLELGYLIEHGDTRRGALRGQGFELATQGWGNVHAAKGLLISTTARSNGASTVLDSNEAVAQLKGAERSLEGMHDTLQQQNVPALTALKSTTQLREKIDPQVDGKYSGEVNGQSAMKPDDGRTPGSNPVERFAAALLLAESPEQIIWTTPASAVAYAGQNLQMTVQQDLHISAGETVSTVSGEHTALFAQEGPIKVIAANGPVSLQANTGELELLADQAITITATDNRIDVLAQQKVVLQAGNSAITLEGGDITFSCPGTFTVKAGQHPFLGGASDAAAVPALPDQTFAFTDSLRFAVEGADVLAGDLGWTNLPFKIVDQDNKEVAAGTVGEDGRLPRVMSEGLGRTLTLQVGEDKWEKITAATGAPPEEDGDNDDDPDGDRYRGELDAAAQTGALTPEQILELLGNENDHA